MMKVMYKLQLENVIKDAENVIKTSKTLPSTSKNVINYVEKRQVVENVKSVTSLETTLKTSNSRKKIS